MTDSSNKRRRTPSGTSWQSFVRSNLLNESSSSKAPSDALQLPGNDGYPSESRPNKKERKQRTPPEDMHTPLPPTSRYLPVALGGSHWKDQRSVQNIVIMGDSYSKSNDSKTWVDHLTRRLGKKYKRPQIHNFAFPGATAEYDLSSQLTQLFTLFPKKDSPKTTPPLDPGSTTYFLFVGINDCGSNECDDLEAIVETIFDAAHDLYVKAGARNFIIVNVPPVDRSPQASDSESSAEMEERVRTWNDLLRTQATEFGTSSKEATVLLFSSHQALLEVLEDPSEFGFSEDDPDTEGGGIWEDDLHLTTDVHDHLAERLLASVVSS
ncbi:hypothetical protein EVG20_g9087 [Dentipellis fragilis]|uniref:SGNH hydrolase-type esterase domain-containing protein n=1 Tax=Dentipellis fragilis TaxID=205917 RepID=A0A4Y9Y3Q3_9AGAM|nr:hypothetical protein EVG20_g9087 [Dentipellis fragilis]